MIKRERERKKGLVLCVHARFSLPLEKAREKIIDGPTGGLYYVVHRRQLWPFFQLSVDAAVFYRLYQVLFCSDPTHSVVDCCSVRSGRLALFSFNFAPVFVVIRSVSFLCSTGSTKPRLLSPQPRHRLGVLPLFFVAVSHSETGPDLLCLPEFRAYAH